MGKTCHQSNLPTNASLSYTLDHLRTEVELSVSNNKQDQWHPFENRKQFYLSPKGQKRFLSHLDAIKNWLDFEGYFTVRSKNNFPLGCGLASSASSFAALTQCAVKAISELKGIPSPTLSAQSEISRKGSGSSCRSFFAPWAIWREEYASEIKLPYNKLLHQVVIISNQEKSISSSEAHKLVMSSPYFDNRIKRAEKRIQKLELALMNQEWQHAYQYVWDEFIDMHKLFQTAVPAFDYMTDDCKALLNDLQSYWEKHGNGPLVTMDAGPNIHLLYRTDDQENKQQIEHDYFLGKYHVI